MKKSRITSFFCLLLSLTITAQVKSNPIPLKINQRTADLKIKLREETNFTFRFKKGIYYSIIVEQKGIDLVIELKDESGKLLVTQDSLGNFGAERIDFLPDDEASFVLSVKPLNKPKNPPEGLYSVFIREVPKTLEKFDRNALVEDFEILENAYIETRVGLWYSSLDDFKKFCDAQKAKITDKMTALDFYRIIAPVVADTNEGHSSVRLSDDVKAFFKRNGKYFPFLVKILDKKVYLLNDVENYKTRGLQVSKINGVGIDAILDKFLSIEPADGYNTTSKYRWIEKAFSNYYAYFFESQPKSFNLELINPQSNEKKVFENISSIEYKKTGKFFKAVKEKIPNYDFKEFSDFKIDTSFDTAILTINDFEYDPYKNGEEGFKAFLENCFKSISDNQIKHLIIDIRKNEGGPQGAEDHLMAYLTDKAYSKYKYVEIPSFTYSFLQYTNQKDRADALAKTLKQEFYRASDGRYYAISGIFEGDNPKENNFKGDVYILIGGLTFSGGSEFAALAKNYTNAKFIGEETGGGYYGNTSGGTFKFTLPNTKTTIRIPFYKFVVDVKENGIPFGHGVLPDYYVQPTIKEYLDGYDAEMEYAKKLIGKN